TREAGQSWLWRAAPPADAVVWRGASRELGLVPRRCRGTGWVVPCSPRRGERPGVNPPGTNRQQSAPPPRVLLIRPLRIVCAGCPWAARHTTALHPASSCPCYTRLIDRNN